MFPATLLLIGLLQTGTAHAEAFADSAREIAAIRESLVVPIGRKIIDIALKYKIDPQKSIDVARCESGIKHEGVYGDKGKAYGVFQFHEKTFDWMAKESGIKGLDYKDRDSQIELYSWAISKGLQGHWTCWKLTEKSI